MCKIIHGKLHNFRNKILYQCDQYELLRQWQSSFKLMFFLFNLYFVIYGPGGYNKVSII